MTRRGQESRRLRFHQSHLPSDSQRRLPELLLANLRLQEPPAGYACRRDEQQQRAQTELRKKPPPGAARDDRIIRLHYLASAASAVSFSTSRSTSSWRRSVWLTTNRPRIMSAPPPL